MKGVSTWLNKSRFICEVGKEPVYITETLTDEEVAEVQKQQRVSEIQMRMSEIVQELKETDYKAIKFSEGLYTQDEYAPTKLARQTLREEFKLLEDKLVELGVI